MTERIAWRASASRCCAMLAVAAAAHLGSLAAPAAMFAVQGTALVF